MAAHDLVDVDWFVHGDFTQDYVVSRKVRTRGHGSSGSTVASGGGFALLLSNCIAPQQ